MTSCIHVDTFRVNPQTITSLTLFVLGFWSTTGQTAERLTIPHQPQPVGTERMGGVDIPDVETLRQMHDSRYVLRAWDGKLQKRIVEKNRLPADPGNVQHIWMVKSTTSAIYVCRQKHIFKSNDGGRSWTAHPSGDGKLSTKFAILDSGDFVGITGGGASQDPLSIMQSTDEGQSWKKLTTVQIPQRCQPYSGKYIDGIKRTSDGTLLFAVDVRMLQPDPEVSKFYNEMWITLCYRSLDDGKTWEPPSTMCPWWAGAEGGIAETPSGKLVATVRYQRPLLPGDPSQLVQQNGGYTNWPYKTLFLLDSLDGGKSWQNFRQLCTRFGQTRGYPVALEDGTLVVTHDTRYGPGGPGTRAMISHDEGQTWQDEVYYLDYSSAPGSYSSSVALNDGLILTVVGSTRVGQGHWDAAEMTAIRWKPIVK